MWLPTIVLLPLVVGTLAVPLSTRTGRAAAAWTAAAVTTAALAVVVSLAPAVFAGQPAAAAWEWLPEIGLNLAFRLDGLSLLFCFLILGIGLLVILYAAYYLSDDDPPGRFYGQLMLFQGAMLGVVLSDNLLLLAVFWEITSVASFLLVGYWGHRADARQGARMALAITGGGGLAMLAGFLLLGHIAGSFEISALNEAGPRIREHGLYPVALLLILLGAFTKSAQFPFHFWLPEAMAAPTPVSSYLHSATLVKAGVFLLLRLHPAIGGGLLFEYVVCTAGLVTLVFAAYVAVFRHDLKGLLAYSTVSHLGLITFLIGLDSPLSSLAAVFHIANHATFKASLFMAAGIIDHETGTRDMRRINGLARYMPWTAALGIVAASAMAGVPLLNGFLSKEMFFAEALHLRDLGLLGMVAPWIVTLGGAFGVAYSARFVHDVFFNGEPRDLPKTPHEPPRFMRLPVEVLVVVCVAVGLAPALTVGPIVALAGAAAYGSALPPYTIALWHGFNLPLAMSAVATAFGVLTYWLLQRRYDLHLHVPAGWTGRLMFHRAMEGMLLFARWLTAKLENGSLQRYLALLVGVAVAAGAWPFLGGGLSGGDLPRTPVNGLALVLAALLAAASVGAAVLHRDRFVATVLVAVAGLVVSLAFAWFSAPDLALTQLSVEVVSGVLVLMALGHLPERTPRESGAARRLRDAVLAALAGGGMAALAWAAMTRPRDSISRFFLEKSVPEGGGANVVNVILVDFRGFDTLGEIVVLVVAALGVSALLSGIRLRAPESGAVPGPTPLLLRTAARLLLPFALLVSFHIFMRGHNLPGGGFIAGLVTSVALVLCYMADGLGQSDERLGLDYPRIAGAGVGLAALTGAGALALGFPFLTSAFGHPVLPLLGEVPLASAMAFDLGVYLAVVGATLLTVATLGHAGLGRPEES